MNEKSLIKTETKGLYRPLAMLDELVNDLEHLWQKPWMPALPWRGRRFDKEEMNFMPRVDIFKKDGTLVVKADLPGMKREDIQVDIDGNQISVRAEVKKEREEKKGEKTVYSERSYGMVSRSFALPVEVDEQGAKAEYKDGVLNLVLPKKAGGAAKRIAVS